MRIGMTYLRESDFWILLARLQQNINISQIITQHNCYHGSFSRWGGTHLRPWPAGQLGPLGCPGVTSRASLGELPPPPPRWGTGGAAEPALAGCRKVSHAPRAGIYPLLQKNCYPEMELDFDTLLVHFGLCAYVLKNPIIKINNIDYINK